MQRLREPFNDPFELHNPPLTREEELACCRALLELIIRCKNTTALADMSSEEVEALIRKNISEDGIPEKPNLEEDTYTKTYMEKMIIGFKEEISKIQYNHAYFMYNLELYNTMNDAMCEENFCYIVVLYKLFDYLSKVVSDKNEMNALLDRFSKHEIEKRNIFSRAIALFNSEHEVKKRESEQKQMIRQIFDIACLLHNENLRNNDRVFIMLLLDNAIRTDKTEEEKNFFVSKRVEILLPQKEDSEEIQLGEMLNKAWSDWSAAEKTKSHLSKASSVIQFLGAVLEFINLFAMPLMRANGFIEKQQQTQPKVTAATSMFNAAKDGRNSSSTVYKANQMSFHTFAFR